MIPARLKRKNPRKLTEEERGLLIRWYLENYGEKRWRADARRLTTIAPSVEIWMLNPRTLDIPGVDTPGSRLPSRKLIAVKKRPRPPRPKRPRETVLPRLDELPGLQPYTGGKARKSRIPGEIRGMADVLWGYMRGHKGYNYIHALSLARQIKRLGLDLERFDPATLDFRLEYEELVGEMNRRYGGGGPRRSRDYIEYMEARINEVDLEPPVEDYGLDAVSQWELRHFDDLLL